MKSRARVKLLASVAATLALCSPIVFAQGGNSAVLSHQQASRPAGGANGPFVTSTQGKNSLPRNNPTTKGIDLGSHWNPIGPSPITQEYGDNGAPRSDSGRVASIAISETQNSETVYVGAANGGVWSSNNNGRYWQPLTDSEPSLATGSVAVDPNNPNTIYVGTGEQHFSADSRYGQGILKSTDGGKTWTTLGADVFGGLHIGKVAIDPLNSQHVWVAADNGVWLSTDGGVKWKQMFSHTSSDIYIDAKTPGTIYVSSVDHGLYKSTDGGNTFTLMGDGTLPNGASTTNPNPNMFNASLAVVEGGANGDTIYTSYSDSAGNLMGMFKSQDGGATWKQLDVPQYFDAYYSYNGIYYPQDPAGQGWYDNVIAVDPTDPNHIIAGGITLIESYDGGATWKTLDTFFNAQPGDINTHPDQHAIVFDREGNAFVGNDGGVFEESKSGQWSNLNSNLDTVTFYPGLSAVNGGTTVLAGAQDNGTSLYSGQKSWTQMVGGDGGYTYIDPSNPQDMFAETQYGNIYYTSDGGNTWSNASPLYLDPNYLNGGDSQDRGISAPFVTPYVARPLSGGMHEVLVGADVLYRSTDNGATYQPISPFFDNYYVSAVAQSPTDPNVIYVGTTNGEVWVTFDGGGQDPSNWHKITPQGFDSHAQVASIAINPANDKEITVTYGNSGYYNPLSGNHVYWTADTSATTPSWTNVSSNLPSTFVMSSTYVGNAVVVGTEQGVYIAPHGTTNWFKLGSDLPNAPVTSLVYDGNGKVTAGTYGRGAFEFQMSDAMQLTK